MKAAGTQLIAHRGASGYAPENTKAAFALALRMGASSLELDVQQTKDGRLVVIHDLDLKRVGGVSKPVRSMTFEEISRVDVGGWFDPRFRGERVPLLEEVLDLAERRAPGRVELQIEIKNGRRPHRGIEARVLGALDSRPEWRGRVVLSSFDHKVLRRVRAVDAKMRLGYLVGTARRAPALRETLRFGCESVHLSLRRVDPKWVEAVHAAGRRIFVYTVNSAEDCRVMRAIGVDAVFTNFLDRVGSR